MEIKKNENNNFDVLMLETVFRTLCLILHKTPVKLILTI